jgi:hypothetical protein
MRALIAAIPILAAVFAPFAYGTAAVDACAGLIGSNGAVNLGRTTTLAAYHDGVEHYVTSFEFAGGGGEFGTLIPLPDVPTDVERGGDWTLQRLQLETQPPVAEASFDGDAARLNYAPAEVIAVYEVDALDLTVLKGGGPSVAEWATEHGFRLSPDAPEVLDFYAERSPIFLAAVFDGQAAAERGQQIGDGTPVHITIPTDNPWVPLRILALGKQSSDFVQADVFLLTDERPALLYGPRDGVELTHSEQGSDLLMSDLRSDQNSEWIPEEAWLTKIAIDTEASNLNFDLAIDADGNDAPSRVDAGFELPNVGSDGGFALQLWMAAALAAVLGAAALFGRRLGEARGS